MLQGACGPLCLDTCWRTSALIQGLMMNVKLLQTFMHAFLFWCETKVFALREMPRSAHVGSLVHGMVNFVRIWAKFFFRVVVALCEEAGISRPHGHLAASLFCTWTAPPGAWRCPIAAPICISLRTSSCAGTGFSVMLVEHATIIVLKRSVLAGCSFPSFRSSFFVSVSGMLASSATRLECVSQTESPGSHRCVCLWVL